jgi:hypothetical protein
MSAELMGAAATWLAHAAWYLADPLRRARLLPSLTRRAWLSSAWLSRMGRLGAALFVVLASGFWIRAHGVTVGACCTLAALTAAASINTIVAPFSARVLLALCAASALLLLLGGLQVLVGA